MLCLSVQQPWAWAIVTGIKRVENRVWPTAYRGPLLIHAGKSKSRLGDEGDSLPGLPPYDELPYGAVVGVVELVDCVRPEAVAGLPFAEGPWCFVLAGARELTPVPYSGQQRLFHVPDSVVPEA